MCLLTLESKHGCVSILKSNSAALLFVAPQRGAEDGLRDPPISHSAEPQGAAALHFQLPPAENLYVDANLIFQQVKAPDQTHKGTKSWFNHCVAAAFNWPANWLDLNPIENIWEENERRQTLQCRWSKRQINMDGLHDTPHRCSKLCKRRSNQVLGANEPSFKIMTFLLKISLLIDLM